MRGWYGWATGYGAAKGDSRKGQGKGDTRQWGSNGYVPTYRPAWRNGNGGNNGNNGNNNNSYGDRGMANNMKDMCNMLQDRENREWQKEEDTKKEKKEEEERKARQEEQEERKREREETKEFFRAQQESFLKRIKKGTGSTAPTEEGEDPPGSGGDPMDYKAALVKGRGKRQVATAPVDPNDWMDFECSRPQAKKVLAEFKDYVSEGKLMNQGILDCANLLNGSNESETKAELQGRYTRLTRNDPPARWSKVDLYVGCLAKILE